MHVTPQTEMNRPHREHGGLGVWTALPTVRSGSAALKEPGTCQKRKISSPSPDLLNPNLCSNKPAFEKHCSKACLIMYNPRREGAQVHFLFLFIKLMYGSFTMLVSSIQKCDSVIHMNAFSSFSSIIG